MKITTLIFLILLGITISLTLVFTVWATTAPVTWEITGLKPFLQRNVNLVLNKELQQAVAPTEQQRIVNFYNNSPNYILEALKPYGYFKPLIQKTMQQKDNHTTFKFIINPGPRITLNNVQIQILGDGERDPAFARLLTKFKLKAGRGLNSELYQQAKNDLYNLATQRGYFFAKFVRSQLIIDLAKYQANIVFIFDTGTRYRFGPTYFSRSRLRLDFLQRYLNYQQGDYYTNEAVQQTQQDLATSSYFKQVIVTPEPEHTINDEVPIKISLDPSNPRQYIFGVGYGTDTGPRATLGLQLRQINSRGHNFDFLMRASQNDSTLAANYNIPGRHPARDTYTLNAGVFQLNQDTGKSHSYRAGPNYNHVTKSRNWNINVGAYYLDEQYTLQDLPQTHTNMLIPNLHIAHLHQAVLMNPKKGYDLSVDIAGANDAILSKSSFTQEKIQGKGLYTLPTHTRLLAHGEIGRTDISDINQLPLSLQLFAGGSSSIRGYSYNSIGPGRNLLVLSGEVQQRIYKDLYLAAFYDVGNVGDKDYLSDLKQGVGPGLVWVSPIGSFELTVARRINKNINHSSYQIQFSMGPDL